ncbi:Alpha/Beta hydrolase protein [Xylariaceae sp. FL0255]|nr:Alpha/Beta hydrolase protein [Xylariaceae sp. FL0255]
MPIEVVEARQMSPSDRSTDRVYKSYRIRDYKFRTRFDYSKTFNYDDETNTIDLHFKLVGANKDKTLVFLCGGPGDKNTRPEKEDPNDSVEFFLAKGYSILYPDYRGTGDSQPSKDELDALVNRNDTQGLYNTMARLMQRDIVHDLESVRLALKIEKWTLFGQSFGTGVAVCYASWFPTSLTEVLGTGAIIPAFAQSPSEVFENLFDRVKEACDIYYSKDHYPQDIKKVKEIVKWLAKAGDEGIPISDGKVTAKMFLCLGRRLGKPSQFEELHELVEKMAGWAKPDEFGGDPTRAKDLLDAEFRKADNWKVKTRPLYISLSEMQYCARQNDVPNWAAKEVAGKKDEYWWVDCPTEDLPQKIDEKEKEKKGRSLYFSGEMVYPFFFDAYDVLKPYTDVADLLAKQGLKEDMYNSEALKKNTVQMTFLISEKDMYVDPKLSKKTADKIPKCNAAQVEDYYHAQIRISPKEVLEKLWASRKNEL